jgi:hypothetical protein
MGRRPASELVIRVWTPDAVKILVKQSALPVRATNYILSPF